MTSSLMLKWVAELRRPNPLRISLLLVMLFLPLAGVFITYQLSDFTKVVWSTILVVLFGAELLYRRIEPENKNLRERFFFIIILLVFSIMLGLSGLITDWRTGKGDYYSQGCLIPYSDAAGYYTGALSFLEHGELNSFSARRPIGVIYFAVLSALTRQNLQGTLLLSTVLVALSFFFTAQTIMRSWGMTAGVIVVLGLSSVAREFNHTVMTEPAGFICGSIAAVLLWDGLMKNLPMRFVWGIGMLTLALGIRTGPWFIVPLLLCFCSIRWRNEKLFNGRLLLYGICTIGLYLIINFAVLKVAGYDSPGHFNANFSYTLYGMIKGGKGWTAICHDFPEKYGRMSDEDFCTFTYKQCAIEFEKHPEGIFIGIGRGFLETLKQARIIILPLNRVLPPVLRLLLFIGGLGALIFFFRQRIDQLMLNGLVLTGILLSGPFILDAFNRALTVSYPYITFIYAAAPGVVLSRFIHTSPGRTENRKSFTRSIVGMVTVPIALILLVFLIKGRGEPDYSVSQKSTEVLKDTDTLLFRVSQGSFVELLPDSCKTRIPAISRINFLHDNIAMIEHPEVILQPGEYIGLIYDMSKKPDICTYLILGHDPKKYAGSIVSVPVKWVSGRGHIFYRSIGEPVSLTGNGDSK